MLRRLLIRDFVIVDRLELDFAAGFGALTGETGAGKSILVDALSLILGSRGDGSVVRQAKDGSEKRADISGEFDLEPGSALGQWLRDNDFDADGGACLLRRVIDAGGRSRAYVNGSPATLAQLKEAGAFLADIHGQHAHHALLRPDAQRHLVDSHGGLLPLAREVAEKYRVWAKLQDALSTAEKNAAANAREREMLEWQVQELSGLGFEPNQWLETNQEFQRLSHAATLLDGAASASSALEDGDYAVLPMVEKLSARLAQLAQYDAGLADVQSLLEAAQIQLSEAGHALRHYGDRMDLDPERLSEVSRRIDAVESMARKYRVTAEELPGLLAEMSERLSTLQETADPAALQAREAAAKKDYLALAEGLSAQRRQVAAALATEVTASMQELALTGGRFDIALEALEAGAATGLEKIEFLVAANLNQAPRSLAKVASGGELSRIGLAIQVITSKSGETPTLVFDEVDVGIGGRVAEIVGRLLQSLGKERQVLCVTHLPQVASQAHWQWNIAKDNRNGETLSRVTPLDDDGRIDEIARMLGGVNITDTTRRHAAEMLGLAG